VATVSSRRSCGADWGNHELSCEGGARPDGSGIRVALASLLPVSVAGKTHRLRFVFGIDLADTAAGGAQALPTNLTVILEGEATLFATLGDDKCAVELLERRPLLAQGAGLERIHARGYCIGPATDANGEQRLFVPTFEFAGVIRNGDAQ
jgi:hypothetical protein